MVDLSLKVAENVFQTKFYHFQYSVNPKLKAVRSFKYNSPVGLDGHIDCVLGLSIDDLPKAPLHTNCGHEKSVNRTKIEVKLSDQNSVTPYDIQQTYNVCCVIPRTVLRPT